MKNEMFFCHVLRKYLYYMNDDNKAFSEFIKELLHIDDGFAISRIERTLPPDAFIRIHLEYQLPYYEIGGIRYDLYDHAPLPLVCNEG